MDADQEVEAIRIVNPCESRVRYLSHGDSYEFQVH
jgi:hypothetical protein